MDFINSLLTLSSVQINDLNEILPILDKAISMYNNLSYEVVSAKNKARKLIYT